MQHHDSCSPTDEFTGLVFDIQRMSLQDGPGIRTTVFLKGCSLRCVWCHNPEGLEEDQELWYNPALCIRCGACVGVCPENAQQLDDTRDRNYFRDRCGRCLACAAICPTGAMAPVARRLSVHEIMDVVLRDRLYYEESGGGLTLSGGEPAAHYHFAEALLRRAKQAGIHCCMETSGQVGQRQLLALAPLVDIFLYDYKMSDPDLHRLYTGVDNSHILANLHALDRQGAQIILRCPLMSDINLNDAHIECIGRVAGSLSNCSEVQLLVWHGLGESKYARLGKGLPDLAVLAGDATDMAVYENASRRLARLWKGRVRIV